MIFIDSNIFISYYNKDDENHRSSVKIMKDVEEGKYGDVFISDYIFSEIMTVALIRLKDKKEVIRFGTAILRSKIRILKINQKIFNKAWQLFQGYDLKMSFADFTNLAILQIFNIKNIATFDKDFKKIKNIKVINN